MKILIYVLMLMAASTMTPVSAGEPIQPSAYWRAVFGHDRPTSLSYGFALWQPRADRRDIALPALATLDFNRQGTVATLAGLPFWRQQYRLNESGETQESESDWLPGASTLLIAGGAVAAVVLLSGDDDEEDNGTSNVPQNSPCVVEGALGGCTVQCPEGTVEGCTGALSAASLVSSYSVTKVRAVELDWQNQ